MANNPRNRENLIAPKKGEVRNPTGRPKGSVSRSAIAKKILSMVSVVPDKIFDTLKDMYPELEKNMSIEEIMTIVQAHKAITKQDTVAYEKILDSAYGRAKQETDVTTNGKDVNQVTIFELPNNNRDTHTE